MPEIQGEFSFVRWVRPEEKVGRWESKFASAPDAEWKTLFEYELAVEASHSGNSAGTSRTIDGATITFDSPDSWAKAAADMIRRTAQKTDTRMVDARPAVPTALCLRLLGRGVFAFAATGKEARAFARVGTLSKVIRENAHRVVSRCEQAFTWAERELRQFYSLEGANAFRLTRQQGGLER